MVLPYGHKYRDLCNDPLRTQPGKTTIESPPTEELIAKMEFGVYLAIGVWKSCF